MLLSSLPVGFAPLTYVGCLFIVGYAIQFIWYFLFILLFSTFSSILWALGFAWLALALTIEKPQSGGQTNQPTNKETNRQTNVYKRGHSHCTTGRMSYELCAMRRLAVCVAATKTSWCVFVPFSIAIFLVCLFAHLNCLICIKWQAAVKLKLLAPLKNVWHKRMINISNILTKRNCLLYEHFHS